MNTGDTVFVLISAALVMLMTPGLALFYGGMARQKNVLVSSFHPELTDDTRIHKYFIGMIREYVKEK